MKRLLLAQITIIFIALNPFSADARWVKSYDILENKYDKAVSVLQTTAVPGFIVFNDDMTVLKLTSTGIVQWAANYFRGCYNSPKQIVETSDSGYVLLANHRSTDPDNCTGSDKLWVIKIDAAGQVLWQKTFQGAGDSIDAVQIREVTVDNSYILAGNSKNSETDTDIWVIRIDSSGGLVWQNTFSIDGKLLASSVIYDQTNVRFVISGSRQQGAGYPSGVIMSLDNFGTIDWSNRYSNTTYLKSVVHDEPFYVAAGTSTDIENDSDALVVKVNVSDGTTDSAWKYGSSDNHENIKQIVTTSGGGYAFICDTNLYGLGSYDALLTKIKADLSVEWGRTFGGEKFESALTLQNTADSGFIVGGFTKSFPDNPEYMNMFLMKLPSDGDYDNCTKVGETAISNSSVAVNDYSLAPAVAQMSPTYITDTVITGVTDTTTYNTEIVCFSKDTDGDGILDDGDNSGIAGDNLCEDKETEDCDDNCRYDCNFQQEDYDHDEIGDVCDRVPGCGRVCGANPCEQGCNF